MKHNLQEHTSPPSRIIPLQPITNFQQLMRYIIQMKYMCAKRKMVKLRRLWFPVCSTATKPTTLYKKRPALCQIFFKPFLRGWTKGLSLNLILLSLSMLKSDGGQMLVIYILLFITMVILNQYFPKYSTILSC